MKTRYESVVYVYVYCLEYSRKIKNYNSADCYVQDVPVDIRQCRYTQHAGDTLFAYYLDYVIDLGTT